MNISVQMLVIVTAACLCVAHAAPDMRGRTKQQRPTRGFKNVEMMTARGFGKRDRPIKRTTLYGEQPEETLWESLEQPGEMDPNDSRDEKQDSCKKKTRCNHDVTKSTTEHFESEKENVQLRHTMDEKKRRQLSKSGPRSVKSMKMMNSGIKTKQNEKKRKPKSKSIVSIAVDTFTKEMIRNPEFAKTVVRRFIDRNLDGFLTEDELLKANI